MISKNLFFKMIKQDIRKRIWYPILTFIVYFVAMEVRMLMEMERFLNHSDAYSYDIATVINEYFFGRQAAVLFIITCFTAFLGAISGYAYLHVKKQIDTYHSLPVSRSQIFWSRYLSGILQFLVPFVVHVLICAGIAAGRNVFTIQTFFSMMSFIGLQVLIYILSYSVSVMAVGLTGNIIVSILGTAVLFSYSTLIAVLVEQMLNRFFSTYIVYGNRGIFLSEKVWCFSPLSMILKLFSSPNNTTMEEAEKFFKYDTSYVWVLIVGAAAYSLMAYFIYLKRTLEAAGKPIAFRAAEPVIKTMIVIPASFYIGGFFSEISNSTDSDNWFLFGLIFGFAIFCILMEIVFRLDIRGALMHKKQFLFNAACTAFIFVILKYDVTGYDTYVPADSQLQSCAVSIQDLITLSQTARLNDFGVHFLNAEEYRMANMEIQGNSSAMELARKAAEEQLAYQFFDYYEGIEESPEYIETVNKQLNYRQISFGYKLLNGKTVYRSYIIDIGDADTLRLLSDIFNDYDYKLGSTPLFNEDWDIAFSAVRCESNFKRTDITLTPDMQSKLVEVYREEYAKLTLDTVMNVAPVGTVDFMTNRERENSGYLSYSGDMYVYPQFTETIALLKEYGFDMEERLTADDVRSISITKDKYVSTPSYFRSSSYQKFYTSVETTEDDVVEYTDKEQMQQILDNVVSDGFTSGISSYAGCFDRQYLVRIESNVDGFTTSFHIFVKGRIPDFVTDNL